MPWYLQGSSEWMKCHWPSLFSNFPITSCFSFGFLFSLLIFLLILLFLNYLFLKPQSARTMAVKSNGSVYHIDVDLDASNLS